MDKKKLFTLSLKFKRHNIQFEYNEASKYIIIGKTEKVKRKIIQGVLLVAIGLTVIIAFAFFKFFARRVFTIVLLAPIAYGLSEIYKYVKLAKTNKSRKIIASDSFTVESPKGVLDHSASAIENIDIEIKKDIDSLEGEASIYFQMKNDQRIHILSWRSEKVSDAKLDLEYLKDFLQEFMNIKKNDERPVSIREE